MLKSLLLYLDTLVAAYQDINQTKKKKKKIAQIANALAS